MAFYDREFTNIRIFIVRKYRDKIKKKLFFLFMLSNDLSRTMFNTVHLLSFSECLEDFSEAIQTIPQPIVSERCNE